MECAGQLIRWWLSRPMTTLVGILFALEAGVAGLMYALVIGRHTRDFMSRHCRTLPLILMPILLMLGLLVGFLGAEIQRRNQHAGRCVAEEGRALDTLHCLTRTSSGILGDVRDAARRYAAVVVKEEFPRFGSAGENAKAAAAIEDLERVAAGYATEPDSSAVVAGGIMDSVLLLKKCRVERSLLLQVNSEFEWITVLSLSLPAIVAVGFGQMDNPRMMLAAWVLLIPAIVVMLGMLALRENPFSPPLSVQAAPLESAFATSPRGETSLSSSPWGGAATFCTVPEVGLEPTRHCWQRILSPPRLPFRHSGS
jgi:hypothetical protein